MTRRARRAQARRLAMLARDLDGTLRARGLHEQADRCRDEQRKLARQVSRSLPRTLGGMRF